MMVYVREVEIDYPSGIKGKRWIEDKSLWIVNHQGILERRLPSVVELLWFKPSFLALCGFGLLGISFLSLLIVGLNFESDETWTLTLGLIWIVILSLGRVFVKLVYRPYSRK